MTGPLERVAAASRAGRAAAIPSVCTAHPDAIEASLRLAAALGRPIVVEATSNQVNHEGGYTGQRPDAFAALVRRLADRAGLDPAALVLGGDHLGPQPWRALPPEAAMERAEETVRAYARAGFAKIHLDCSEGCAGESPRPPEAVAVARAARLARAAAGAARDAGALPPVFVVGTEVPPPGGARAGEEAVRPTDPAAAQATLDAHWEAVTPHGRIVGLVVQPGVEFDALAVHHLPLHDPGLRDAVRHREGVVLEAHSTDYQRPEAFRRLAEWGFAFQKVGPALTFAWREAVYALDALARAAGWLDGPSLPEAMERLMRDDPRHWERHLDLGADLRLQRHFAWADRIRYYWPRPEAQAALARLRAAYAGRALPDPFLRAGLPAPVLERAEGLRTVLPPVDALLQAAVQEALAPYFLPDPA